MHIRCKDDLALTETLLPNIQPFSGGTRTGYQDTMVYDDRTTHRPTVGVITYVKEWHKSYWTQAQTRITRLIIFFCKNTEDIQHIIIELSLFTCSIHEQTPCKFTGDMFVEDMLVNWGQKEMIVQLNSQIFKYCSWLNFAI